MKPSIGIATALLAATATLLALPARAANVTVNIYAGDPAYYGPLDVRDLPPPRLVYAEPVVIVPAPRAAPEPLYIRVPPGHAKHWDKHCRKYHACDRPVYFVDDGWYNEVYVAKHGKHDKRDKQDKHDKHDKRGKHEKHEKHDKHGHDD